MNKIIYLISVGLMNEFGYSSSSWVENDGWFILCEVL